MNIEDLKDTGKKLLGMKHKNSHKTFVPDLMAKVHKDKKGSLATRMYRQFTPPAPITFEKPKKEPQPWAGNKIAKACHKGRCSGGHVDGVVGAAIRLMHQERMIEKLGSDHIMQ